MTSWLAKEGGRKRKRSEEEATTLFYVQSLTLSNTHRRCQSKTTRKTTAATLTSLTSCSNTHKCACELGHKTHTHTHVGFYGLRGLSIGVMVFILYKLYVLLPYTYTTPKLSPHRRLCISIFPQKFSLCMIYKRFKLWGH